MEHGDLDCSSSRRKPCVAWLVEKYPVGCGPGKKGFARSSFRELDVQGISATASVPTLADTFYGVLLHRFAMATTVFLFFCGGADTSRIGAALSVIHRGSHQSHNKVRCRISASVTNTWGRPHCSPGSVASLSPLDFRLSACSSAAVTTSSLRCVLGGQPVYMWRVRSLTFG